MEENQSLIFLKEEEKESEEKQNEVSSNGIEAAKGDQSCQLETLVVPFDSEQFDVIPLASLASPESKIEQFEMSRQEDLAFVTAQAQTQMQVQVGSSYSSSELLPVPIKQSLSSRITPSPLRQRPPPLHQDNNVWRPELNQENSNQKMELAHILVKSPSSDGYNWRKYGQKPVKSNDSSRSYYRCTHSNCHAKKKVECCDHSGNVIEIIYKGQHNHDPPRKIRHTKARICLSTVGDISSPEPGEGSGNLDSPARELSSSYSSTSRKKLSHATPEQELHSSSDYASNAIVKSEDNCDQIRAKRRMKGRSVTDADSLIKIVKEPKIVVQASSDAGMSGDGYRWRKYGQKMVKGNSNPRSYYKCTSAGCPVRKHVERATDNTTTVMITYEGKHDHDMPVPKKHHGPPSADLIAAATATATNNAEVKKSEDLVNPQSSTQLSMDVEMEVANKKATEFGSEKPLESARTLLSIGIELRPY